MGLSFLSPNYKDIMTAIKVDSVTQRVLAVIKDDPGVSAKHISEQLGDVPTKSVSLALAHLRRTNQIRNLGKHAKGASWYPKG